MPGTPDVQIPSRAVSDETDLRAPTRALLEDLNLLGTAEAQEAATGFTAAFTGPPQSVALIQAGATAAAKWWATGLGATVIATWASVAAWWADQHLSLQIAVLAGATLISGALVLSIGYLLASDVRGRAAAAVSLIEARASLATRMIQAAEATHAPAQAASAAEIVPMPTALRVKNHAVPAADEDGWLAVAMERQADASIKYMIVKGSAEATLPVSELHFL